MTPPSTVVINRRWPRWTNAQFLDGDAIKRNALVIKIAAGNVRGYDGGCMTLLRPAGSPFTGGASSGPWLEPLSEAKRK